MKHSIRISDISQWLPAIAEIRTRSLKANDHVTFSLGKIKPEEIMSEHIASLSCCLQYLQDRNISISMKKPMDRHWYADRVFGLWKIDEGTSADYTTRLYRHLKVLNPEKDLTAVRMGINELIYNVFDHSESSDNAFIHTSYDYYSRQLHIACCDFGIGIAKLVRRFHPDLPDDKTAIRKATEFSFTTRSRPHNGGIGLDNVISSCSDTDELFIISNKGQIIVQNNNMSTFALDYEFPGTLIFYRISITELPDIDNDDLDDVYI